MGQTTCSCSKQDGLHFGWECENSEDLNEDGYEKMTPKSLVNLESCYLLRVESIIIDWDFYLIVHHIFTLIIYFISAHVYIFCLFDFRGATRNSKAYN